MLGGGLARTSMTVPPVRSRESKSSSGGERVDDWSEGTEDVEVLQDTYYAEGEGGLHTMTPLHRVKGSRHRIHDHYY